MRIAHLAECTSQLNSSIAIRFRDEIPGGEQKKRRTMGSTNDSFTRLCRGTVSDRETKIL